MKRLDGLRKLKGLEGLRRLNGWKRLKRLRVLNRLLADKRGLLSTFALARTTLFRGHRVPRNSGQWLLRHPRNALLSAGTTRERRFALLR